MFQQINAHKTSEELLSKLSRTAAFNVAMHVKRLELLTVGFTLEEDEFVGVERDYLVATLYSLNECIGILNACGDAVMRDVIFMNCIEAREYFDRTIEKVHGDINADPAVKEDLEAFEAHMKIVNPPPEGQPIPDEFGDDEGLSEEEKKTLVN